MRIVSMIIRTTRSGRVRGVVQTPRSAACCGHLELLNTASAYYSRSEIRWEVLWPTVDAYDLEYWASEHLHTLPYDSGEIC